MTARRRATLVTALLLGVAGAAAPAVAAPPTIERVAVDDTFSDDFLSEACGVDVITRAVGRLTLKSWGGDGTGPVEMTNVNLTLIASAGDNTYRFKDVGADLLRRAPNGDLVLSIIGQIPFAWNGVLKINLVTGEVVLEPKPSNDVQRACAALTA